LAPAYEIAMQGHGLDSPLGEFAFAAAAAWPGFAADLSSLAEGKRFLLETDTLAVASDAGDRERLCFFMDRLNASGIAFDALSAEALVRLEPALSPTILAGLRLPTDRQVDHRAVITALIDASLRAGTRFLDGSASADVTISCKGWQDVHCQPVKGQMIALRKVAQSPTHIIRSQSLYVVPKKDRILIGATEEYGCADRDVDIAATDELLRRAIEICPSLAGVPVMDRWAGIRPGTDSGMPLIGWGDPQRRTFIATGHFRHGILMAPLTAHIVADAIVDGVMDPLAVPFAPTATAPAIS